MEARWEWFNLIDGNGYCVVKNADFFETKTRKERKIPFHSRFTAYYTELRERHPDATGYILHPECEAAQEKHLRWHPHRPFRILMKAENLEWVTFHTMRHTFGSLHAMAGTAELKIRRWLGITPQTFERHYAGLRLADSDADRI